MAGVSLKRHRDAVADSDKPDSRIQIFDYESDPKKQKPTDQKLSSHKQDEDEPDHDLSSLMSSLENETICTLDFDSLTSDPFVARVDEEPVDVASGYDDEKERVIRHLLEASDDELGLPGSKSTNEIEDAVVIDSGYSFGICAGPWELEDEAANYYALLQSELFM